jgi:hypothetical protein
MDATDSHRPTVMGADDAVSILILTGPAKCPGLRLITIFGPSSTS